MDTVLEQEDEIIAISEDDDTIRLPGDFNPDIRAETIRKPRIRKPRPENTLILGWNWRVPLIIREMDHYVPPESNITVMAQVPDGKARIEHECPDLGRVTVVYHEGDTTDRRNLDTLMIDPYDHVIILCYSDLLDPQKADARTLITLLHLRDIAERSGKTFTIVSEMFDVRNRELAQVTRADDFIVSDRLTSLMMSQISENKALNAVFEDLFDAAGSEIYLKPVGSYVKLGDPLTFYTIVESARRQNEVALGYRLHAEASSAVRNYGIVLNPLKSQQVQFSPNDRIIVLAAHE
jgi:hypothetical protein